MCNSHRDEKFYAWCSVESRTGRNSEAELFGSQVGIIGHYLWKREWKESFETKINSEK